MWVGVYKIMVSILAFLRYTNIFLTCSFVGIYLILNFKIANNFVSQFSTNKDKQIKMIETYRHALNTIFRLVVGILLISFQFPFLYKYFSKNSNLDLAKYGNEIAPVIGAAGTIVLFTVSKNDIVKTLDFAKQNITLVSL